MKIAVVNMPTVFGNLKENLLIVKRMTEAAVGDGAEMIIFPEFFTTGFALNPILLQGIRDSNDIMVYMAKLSSEYKVAIGGSYLHYDMDKKNVYNTFGLFLETGEQYFHSKDIPTGIENFCYTDGDEVSSFETPIGRIGIVMCWEQLRWQTVRRMANKVDLLIGGSCWWNFVPEDGESLYNEVAEVNRHLAEQAPLQISRILGVPFVHASHYGAFPGGILMDPLISCNRKIEGNAIITDASGNMLCNSEGNPGYFIHDVNLGCIHDNVFIPEGKVWIPDLPPMMEQGFDMLREHYSQYYENVTRKNLLNM
jgi:predicted amidohydrolase